VRATSRSPVTVTSPSLRKILRMSDLLVSRIVGLG
jgi:hypothetical protein